MYFTMNDWELFENEVSLLSIHFKVSQIQHNSTSLCIVLSVGAVKRWL